MNWLIYRIVGLSKNLWRVEKRAMNQQDGKSKTV